MCQIRELKNTVKLFPIGTKKPYTCQIGDVVRYSFSYTKFARYGYGCVLSKMKLFIGWKQREPKNDPKSCTLEGPKKTILLIL